MQVRFWTPLRGVIKIYGMARLGVIMGVISCVVVMLFFGTMWSIGGAIPGYYFGSYLAQALHNGRAQRLIRWYLPAWRQSLLPPTTTKLFF